MLTSFSDKAIITKAKAMYGRRLKSNDYSELIHKTSVAEVAAYLKGHPSFKQALEGIRETAIHRGQLEHTVKKELFSNYVRLLRYSSGSNNAFYKYVIFTEEIEQILEMIRLINSSRVDEFIQNVPTFLAKYTRYDLMELTKVKTYNDLLNVIKDTPFYDLLVQYIPKNNGHDIDYTACERTLRRYYFSEVEKTINESYKGKTKQQLIDIFSTQAELENISIIYRMKKYYKASAEEIKDLLVDFHSRISKKTLNEMIDVPSEQDFLKSLRAGTYKKYFDTEEFLFIEYTSGCIKYNLSKKYMTFGTSAPTVIASYMVLRDIEVKNIINIIEGIRYHVPPEEIQKILIL